MIRKRKSKNEVSSDSENLEEKQSNVKNMSQNLSKQSKMVDVSKISSPIFNIHIHVPPYNMSSSKIYLPRIQPVIHLHFDEIARKLGMNQNEKDEKSWGKTLESLLPLASPKFGNVKFHFNNKSRGGDLKQTNETPHSARTLCNDSQLIGGKGKEKTQPKASKRSNMVCKPSDIKNTSNKDLKIIKDEMLLSKYNDLNLKKAVVLLTDICKSKTWTNIVSHSDKSHSENTSPQNEMENSDEDKERFQIKQENESPTPPPTPAFDESFAFDNTLENDCGKIKVEEIIVNTSSAQDMVENKSLAPSSVQDMVANKSLTSLVEGCNFSEILNRFRSKYKQYIANNEKSSGESGCNNNMNKECFSETTADNRNLKENNYSDSNTESVSEENKSPSQVRNDSLSIEKENSGRESDEETVDFEFPGMSYSEAGTKSDKLNCTSETNSRAEKLVVDSGTLEFSSSYKISSDREGNFEVSETQNSCLFDVGNVDFHLQLIQKEMKRRSQMSSGSSQNIISKARKKSNSASVKSNQSSPPKRMKPSNKKSEEKSSKPSSSPAEDYISLNASGSTRFAVAPLDRINPYKTHSAKNFKQDMLFGNRVARFSSSDKLRFYQMKQAARRSLNK